MKLGTKVVPLWALALIAITSISTAVGVLIVTRTINQSGIIVSVKDFQVYSDAECTVILTAHDWGELHRSEVKELVFYGKNLGEEDLYLYWSDTAPTDVTFTMFRVNDALLWAAWGKAPSYCPLPFDAVVQLKLVLTVSASAFNGALSEDIVIDAHDAVI